MASRGFQIVVVLFWLASMTWLGVTKIAPLLTSGERPDYHASLPETVNKIHLVGWDLQLNQRQLGWAVNRSERLADGAGVLHSVVHFDQLPVAHLLKQSVPLFKTLLPAGDQLEVRTGWELTIRSRAELQPNHRLHQMQTSVDLGPLKDAVRLDGRVEANILHVQIATTAGRDDDTGRREIKIFERDFDFHSGDVLADSFAPQPKLDRLRIGQTWTIRTYQLLAAQPTMQVIEAKVEADDFITWDDQPIHVRIVAYRSDAGAGLSAAREPIARLWVAEDGQVVRQEMSLGDSRFVLVRMPEKKLDSIRERFEEFLPKGPVSP